MVAAIQQVGDFRVGDRVRLKNHREDDGVAEIAGFYSDIEGGVRLDRELYGFKSWNVEDLEKA